MPFLIPVPAWVDSLLAHREYLSTDTEKMELALELARGNILNSTGGPFGAAIFDCSDSRLVSVGMNLVVSSNNSVLHAEMVAIMNAEAALGCYSLASHGRRYELFSSCAPCAMCLGGILWSGVGRIVCAAEAEDARRIGFDEGPVFDASYRYLEERGIDVVRGFMQAEGQQVLDAYAASGGVIYNRTAVTG